MLKDYQSVFRTHYFQSSLKVLLKPEFFRALQKILSFLKTAIITEITVN